MSTSAVEIEVPFAESITLSVDTLCVDLSDGRTISVPLSWYPRLLHATLAERKHWRLIGRGLGIHWDDLDEDLSVEGLLAGKQREKARHPSVIGSRSDRHAVQQCAQLGRAQRQRAPVSTTLGLIQQLNQTATWWKERARW